MWWDTHDSSTSGKLNQINQQPGVVTLACNPSTWEVEAGGSGVQIILSLPSKFKDSLGYMRSVLAPQTTKTQLGKNEWFVLQECLTHHSF